MRKILWLKQSFHIPYDMNLLNKTVQFIYESLFVDKKYKIQPLRLSRDLILQEPKVLAGTPVVMGTRGLVPTKFWKPLARLSNIVQEWLWVTLWFTFNFQFDFFFRVLYSSPIIMTRTTCKQFLTVVMFNLLRKWKNMRPTKKLIMSKMTNQMTSITWLAPITLSKKRCTLHPAF